MAKYFDGESAVERQVRPELREDRVEFGELSWALGECRLRRLPEGRVSIRSGARELVLEPAEWQDAIRFHPGLARRLGAAHTPRRALAIGLSAAAFVAGAYLAMPWIARLLAGAVSPEREISLFRRWSETPGSHPSEALSRIVEVLSPSYPIEVKLLPSREVNAYAMPGVRIGVTQGIVCFVERPEELAAVLAHEVEHVEQRHALRAVVQQLGMRFVFMMMTGSSGGGFGGAITQRAMLNRYSVHDESDADHGAADRLARAGIDPAHGAAFFERMSRDRLSRALELLASTHPPSAERIAFFRSRALPPGRAIASERVVPSSAWAELVRQAGCGR